MKHDVNKADLEQKGRKTSSALDDVHTAPYAAYAARILADESFAQEQGSNSLSAVLQGPEKLDGIDVFTEAEVNEQITLFIAQFSDNQKELIDRRNNFFLDDLQAVYDEENQTFVIGDHTGAPIISLVLANMGLTELYIPLALKNLALLDCSYNNIATISALPPELVGLYCQSNQLTALPELPQQLKRIYCNENELAVLPKLPPLLEEIDCYTNDLTALPELPLSLKKLNCSWCKLTALPELPPQLGHLFCGGNKLSVLPKLPPDLKDLACHSNLLTAFPDIPDSLNYVEAINNSFDQATKNRLKAKGFSV